VCRIVNRSQAYVAMSPIDDNNKKPAKVSVWRLMAVCGIMTGSVGAMTTVEAWRTHVGGRTIIQSLAELRRTGLLRLVGRACCN
jgi:hypothetical protein